MKIPNKCYICGAEATSREHSPALSYFPEDAKFRINLITVRSCQKHNEDTSKDDEYVRNIICMSFGGNSVAFQQFFDKTLESFKRSQALLAVTTKDAKQVYTDEGGEIRPTYSFQIDRDRFDRVMRKIGYALFFKTYNETWNRELIVMTEYLRQGDMKADEFGELIQQFKPLIDEHPFHGTNPQVFKFSFLQSESDSPHDQILRMVFYEGFEVWITIVPNSSGPKV